MNTWANQYLAMKKVLQRTLKASACCQCQAETFWTLHTAAMATIKPATAYVQNLLERAPWHVKSKGQAFACSLLAVGFLGAAGDLRTSCSGRVRSSICFWSRSEGHLSLLEGQEVWFAAQAFAVAAIDSAL